MKRIRSSARVLSFLTVLVGVFGAGLAQAESARKIEVRVSSIAGASLYLDKGREAGLQAGDLVTIVVPGQGVVQLPIQSVSRTSSRCIVAGGNLFVDIGTRGVVMVPEERFSAPESAPSETAPAAPDSAPPAHPPWEAPLGEFDADDPLLAPATVRDPDALPAEIRGRLYAQYLHNLNLFYGDNQYSIGRAGLELWVDHFLSPEGGLHFDGGLWVRGFNAWENTEDLELQGWPTGLSYYWGGTEEQPLRFEVGRFFHHEFAELGLIDGTEVAYRTERGDRVGFSFGFLPDPFPYLSTGHDLAASAFYRFVSDETEELQAGIAYQKTWHDGEADRDLIIGNLGWYPSPRFSLNGSLWADIYTSDDTVKQTPIELTEGLLNAMFRVAPTWGFGGHVSYFRWPETKRKLYRPISDIYLLRNEVLRVGAQAWKELNDHLRFDVRVDQWFDQDDEGTAWDVGMTISDWPLKQFDLIFGVYDTDGLYGSGPGGRVTLMRFFTKGFVSLGYDSGGFLYNPSRVQFQQQAVHAALNLTLTPRTSFSLTGDYRFGNYQEALSGGLYWQMRF